MTKNNKLFVILLWMFLFSVPAWGQSTTVSGTITDANGQAFANGTYRVQFYDNGLPGPFYWNGSIYHPQDYEGFLDSSGSFSGLSLPSNTSIAPEGTQWRFTVCPASNTPCTSQNIQVTGSTLSISSLIHPPPITVNARDYQQPTAYQDSEIVGVKVGFTYFNLTDQSIHACTIAVPCTWVSVGGGSGGGTVNPSPQYEIGSYPDAGSQSVVGGTAGLTTDSTGNNLNVAGAVSSASVNTATVTSGNVNGTLYLTSSGTYSCTVSGFGLAMAALPSAGGTIDSTGCPNGIDITSDLLVGSATKIVNWTFQRNIPNNIDIADGSDAIQLYSKSTMNGIGSANAGTCTFCETSTTNVSSVIASYPRTNQSIIGLSNFTVEGNASATTANGLLDLQNITDLSTLSNLVIWNSCNTVGLYMHTTSGDAMGPVNLDNLTVQGNGCTGARPVKISSVSGSGVTATINFFGGSYTHPGPGGLPIVDLEGVTAADNSGVNFYGTQFESMNTGDIGILINNSSAVFGSGLAFTASGSAGAAAIKVTGASTQISFFNVDNFNSWTDTIDNESASPAIVIPAATQARIGSYQYGFNGQTNTYRWDDYNGNIAQMDSTGLSARFNVQSNANAFSGAGTNPFFFSNNNSGTNAGFEEIWTNDLAHSVFGMKVKTGSTAADVGCGGFIAGGQGNSTDLTDLFWELCPTGLSVNTNETINGNLTVTGTCTGCGGGGSSITVNGGAALASPTNLQNQSTPFDGVSINVTNPSGSNVQWTLSGTATKSLLPATTAYTDQANTYSTGLQDFSAVTLKVPAAASFVTSASSTLGIDTTENNLHAWLGADLVVPSANQTTAWTNGDCAKIVVTSGMLQVGDNGAICGSGGSSIFTSYQFNTQTAITGTGNYIQTTYPTIFSTAQTGSGTSGSPFIDAITLATQSSNTVFAGPTTGSAAAPTFRALVSADIPNNAANTTGNAATATAAQNTPADCSAGQATIGINSAFNAQGCFTPVTASSSLTDGTMPVATGPSTIANGHVTDLNSLISITENACFKAGRPTYDVTCYGAMGDGSAVSTTASITSGTNSATLTSATGWHAGMGIAIDGAGASGATLVAQIGTLAGTTATLVDYTGAAVNAGTTVSAAAAYDVDNEAILATLAQACATATNSGSADVFFPPGNYAFVTSQTSSATFSACANLYMHGANASEHNGSQYGRPPTSVLLEKNGSTPGTGPTFSDVYPANEVTLRDITITSYNNAIYVAGAADITLDNVVASAGKTGLTGNAAVHLSNLYWPRILGGTFQTSGTSPLPPALLVTGDTGSTATVINLIMRDTKLVGGNISYVQNAAINASQPGYWEIDNVTTESQDNDYLSITNSSGSAFQFGPITISQAATSDSTATTFGIINFHGNASTDLLSGVTIDHSYSSDVSNSGAAVIMTLGTLSGYKATGCGEGIACTTLAEDSSGNIVGTGQITNREGTDFFNLPSSATRLTTDPKQGGNSINGPAIRATQVGNALASYGLDAKNGLMLSTGTAQGWMSQVDASSAGNVDIAFPSNYPPTGLTATPSSTGGTLAAGTYYVYGASDTLASDNCNTNSALSSISNIAGPFVLTGTTSSIGLAWTPAATGLSTINGYCFFTTNKPYEDVFAVRINTNGFVSGASTSSVTITTTAASTGVFPISQMTANTHFTPTVDTFPGALVTNLTASQPVHTDASKNLISGAINLASSDVTGLLPNSNLANPATTVNGQTCTLGSTCTTSQVIVVANAGTTGTTANTLTKLTGAPSTALIAATTDTGGIMGITSSGAGTTGNATITIYGAASCIFDGATTAGDYIQISSSTAGDCHDAGSTFPTSGQILGRVLSTNAAAGTYTVDLFGEVRGSSGGGFTNPMTTLGDIIYGGAAGAATRLAGPTATNSVPQYLVSTPSGGAATAPAWNVAGVPTNAQTGTTYTVAATDRDSYLSFSNAASIAVTLPQAGSTGFAGNFVFSACDIGAGTATITPTTSTISYVTGVSYTSGAASMALTTGQCATIYSDNTNYFARVAMSQVPAETDNDILYGASGVWTKGTALPNGITATTQSANDNSTKVATTAYVDSKVPLVTNSTTTSVTVSSTATAAFYNNQYATAATAVTYTLPTAAAGKQFCFTNSYNGSAANTGALTLQTSASGQYVIFTDGTLSASDGYVLSGGAASDAACVVGVDATHWQLYVQRGSWSKH